jgi:hypothetical protein
LAILELDQGNSLKRLCRLDGDDLVGLFASFPDQAPSCSYRHQRSR